MANYQQALIDGIGSDEELLDRRQAVPPLFAPGEPDPNLPGPETPEPAPEPKKYGTSVGQFGVGAGYDFGKLNSDHASPKYLVGRTLSNFDPNQGITPDVLNALNSLGIGTFSGQKDKLQVGGNVDPRWEGWTDLDVITDFNPERGNNAWGFQSSNPNEPQTKRGNFSSFAFPAGAPIASQLQGDPISRIQDAIAKLSGSGNINIDALLAQLGR